MVIGSGMIANCFASYKKDERFLIFASGVSNSKNREEDAYQREYDLLQSAISEHKNKRLVYFSTCSIYDHSENQSPYVLHKLEMESFIQQNASCYLNVRASNVVGKSNNPNTILNYFFYHIKNKINFDAWVNATRNLIDKDELYKIVDYILQHNLFTNETINVANRKNYSIEEIIQNIEQYLNTKAHYTPVKKGAHVSIDISNIENILQRLGINFCDNYLHQILYKNY